MDAAQQISQTLIRCLKEQEAYELLPQIVTELQEELYRNQDITVISAKLLPESERQEVSKAATQKWGEHRIIWAVDKTLLSGLLIKFRDQVIDASGRNALSQLKNQLR